MLKALAIVGALLGAFMLLSSAGMANPPPGSSPTPEVKAWYEQLRSHEGYLCCSISDCRRTMVRDTASGSMEAWIGKDEYGERAPDAWMPVPVNEIKMRGNRPAGVVGVVVCYYAGAVRCLDLDAGT